MKQKKPLTPDDIMKYEIAEELGLMDKVKTSGWKSLTARESGKIGGMLASRKRRKNGENQPSERKSSIQRLS